MGLRGDVFVFFFHAGDGIRDVAVTGVQTCALPIWGADYAFRQKHFDEGVKYVVKHHPEVDPDGALGAAQVASRFVYAEEVSSGAIAVGQFEPARLEKTRDTYTEYLGLKRKVPLEEIYTNDLL